MMKRLLLTLSVVLGFSGFTAFAQEWTDTIRHEIYDHVVFYDGYRMKNNPDSLLNDGILRHSCSLYSTKLSDEFLDQIGDKLNMNVFITAACDNYDRIGNINIALVPKGESTYSTEEVQRFEIGRFITPFMNKNKQPDTVPYSYEMDYLSMILRDKDIRETYDLWLEFELFGIPYAANEQIQGCKDRNDVFQGTLEFVSNQPAQPSEGNVLLPIVIKKPEYIGNNLNNYKEVATDTIGKTTKTYTFEVSEDVNDSQIVLITSNHGANTNGEEYNRRWHYVYFDDELVLSYKPGRESCEPFRKYNTQTNGIYGYSAKSDQAWQSFSNWCPGDVIDNRIINLGALKAGEHKIRISVPEARFVGNQGDIPVSMYFHGLKEGVFNTASIFSPEIKTIYTDLALNNGILYFKTDLTIDKVEIYNINGERLYVQWNSAPVNVSGLSHNIYLVNIELSNGLTETHKVIF